MSYIEFVEQVPCLETSGLSSSVIFDRKPAASFIPSIASGRKEFIIHACAAAKNRLGPRNGIHYLPPPSLHFTGLEFLLEAWSPICDANQPNQHVPGKYVLPNRTCKELWSFLVSIERGHINCSVTGRKINIPQKH